MFCPDWSRVEEYSNPTSSLLVWTRVRFWLIWKVSQDHWLSFFFWIGGCVSFSVVLLVVKLNINGSLVIYLSRWSIKEDKWRRSAWASRQRVPSRHSLDWLDERYRLMWLPRMRFSHNGEQMELNPLGEVEKPVEGICNCGLETGYLNPWSGAPCSSKLQG